MNYYYLYDGTEVNRDMIKQAYEEGRAILIHTNVAGGGTALRLMLDGNMIDTREQCASVIDEVWSSKQLHWRMCRSDHSSQALSVAARI